MEIDILRMIRESRAAGESESNIQEAVYTQVFMGVGKDWDMRDSAVTMSRALIDGEAHGEFKDDEPVRDGPSVHRGGQASVDRGLPERGVQGGIIPEG